MSLLADSREFCTKVFYITHVHRGFFKADVTTVKKRYHFSQLFSKQGFFPSVISS